MQSWFFGGRRRQNVHINFREQIGCFPSDNSSACFDIVLTFLIDSVLRNKGILLPLNANEVQFILCESTAKISLHKAKRIWRIFPFCLLIETFSIDRMEVSERCAYQVYTSGSTAEKKKVLVPFSNFMEHMSSLSKVFGFGKEYKCRAFAFSPCTFDPFFCQAFIPCIEGGVVYIPSLNEKKSSFNCLKAIKQFELNFLMLTPSQWNSFDQSQRMELLGRNLSLVFGGEIFPSSSLMQIATVTKAKIWNIYGTTECSVWATIKLVEDFKGPVDLGNPIGSTRLLLEPSNGSEISIGSICSLSIGPQYRSCYVKDEKILPQFRASGDLVKVEQLFPLKIAFYGRQDFQVKINGERVNLDCLEETLSMRFNGMFCLLSKQESLVLFSTSLVSFKEIIEFIKDSFSDACIPRRFIRLNQLPLNQNGKICRKSLSVYKQSHERLEDVYCSKVLDSEYQICRDIFANFSLNPDELLIGLISSFQLNLLVESLFNSLAQFNKEKYGNAEFKKQLSFWAFTFSFNRIVDKILHWGRANNMNTNIYWETSSQLIPYCSIFLGQCVDATPCIGSFEIDGVMKDLCFIGSHSGM